MKLSIVLPAYNEEGSIIETIRTLYAKLQEEKIAEFDGTFWSCIN